jgi:hypothetical protein
MAGKGGASRAARLSRRPPCFYNKKCQRMIDIIPAGLYNRFIF